MFGLLTLPMLPVLTGLTAGRLAGGRLADLMSVRLRAMWVLWLAAAAQIVQSTTGLPLLAVVFALVLAWIAINIARAAVPLRIGLAVALGGLAANGAAIVLNERMPYAPEAAEAAGLAPSLLTPKNEPMDDSTVVGWLGDTLPIPPLGAVISLGDVLIALGVAATVALLMRPPREPTAQDPGATGS